MNKHELDDIVAQSKGIEQAVQATLATFNGWKCWNVRIDQGRELGGQIIALSGLVARLAVQLEQLSGQTSGPGQA